MGLPLKGVVGHSALSCPPFFSHDLEQHCFSTCLPSWAFLSHRHPNKKANWQDDIPDTKIKWCSVSLHSWSRTNMHTYARAPSFIQWLKALERFWDGRNLWGLLLQILHFTTEDQNPGWCSRLTRYRTGDSPIWGSHCTLTTSELWWRSLAECAVSEREEEAEAGLLHDAKKGWAES